MGVEQVTVSGPPPPATGVGMVALDASAWYHATKSNAVDVTLVSCSAHDSEAFDVKRKGPACSPGVGRE